MYVELITILVRAKDDITRACRRCQSTLYIVFNIAKVGGPHGDWTLDPHRSKFPKCIFFNMLKLVIQIANRLNYSSYVMCFCFCRFQFLNLACPIARIRFNDDDVCVT